MLSKKLFNAPELEELLIVKIMVMAMKRKYIGTARTGWSARMHVAFTTSTLVMAPLGASAVIKGQITIWLLRVLVLAFQEVYFLL